MSGFPGRFFWHKRKRKPIENKTERTIFSGFVSLERTLDITKERLSFEMLSVIRHKFRSYPFQNAFVASRCFIPNKPSVGGGTAPAAFCDFFGVKSQPFRKDVNF